MNYKGEDILPCQRSTTQTGLALDHGKDVTCIAATGFGKSLAFYMAVFLIQAKNLPKKIKQYGVFITPIDALGQDQVMKCQQYGINAVCLTDKAVHLDRGLINAVIKGEYNLGRLI